MQKLISWLALFRSGFLLLRSQDPIRLAAATAFFALFALPPILLILTTFFGMVFRGAIDRGEIFNHLSLLVGQGPAEEVQRVLLNIRGLGSNRLVTIGGSVFLLFVSTTLFVVIKNSFHQLWRVMYKPHSSRGRELKDRLLSLFLILFTGILFIFGLLTEFGLALLQRTLREFGHEINVVGLQIINALISVVLFSVWFAILFRFLPYVRIAWKAIWAGAVVTSLLFSVGTYLMGVFLINSNLNTIYGAAGSLVVLLLFVFYSSLILYFGASFVWVFAEQHKQTVRIKEYAQHYTFTPAN